MLAVVIMIPKVPEETFSCPKCEKHRILLYNTTDDITFITVPKPNPDSYQKLRYKLAISSWLAISPKSRVILYIDFNDFDSTGALQKEFDDLYGKGRVEYLGKIKSNFKDIPYIDDWFRRGVQDSKTLTVCFINSDIILSSKWFKRVNQVFDILNNKKVVLINQRIDFDLNIHDVERLNFTSPNFLQDIDSIVMRSSHEAHSLYGVDTFTFRTYQLPFNPNIIPPFIIGRYNWDNWLTGYLNRYCKTVSFLLDPPIYHINHQRHHFDQKDPLVKINSNLRSYSYNYFGANDDTHYFIKDGYLQTRISKGTPLPPLD